MRKQSILLLLFTLLFTACVENGQALKPTINTSMANPITTKDLQKVKHTKTKPTINTVDTKQNVKKVTSPTATKMAKVPQEEKIISKASTDNNDFFTFSEETKNKISGFFVIIIGIIILI